MKQYFQLMVLGVMLAMLAACQAAAPVRQFSVGETLAYYDFNEAGTFEEGTYEDGTVRLEIQGGQYVIDLSEGDSTFWYGQWGEPVGDAVIDVQIRQTSEDPNTTYGVMCRTRGRVGLPTEIDPQLAALASNELALLPEADAPIETAPEATVEATSEATLEVTVEGTAEATVEATSEAAEGTAEATSEATVEATAEATAEATLEEGVSESLEGASNLITASNVPNGDGYLFLIQGTGRYAILRSVGRNITPLVNWAFSGVINQGAAQNRMRVVCMGSYLALYINDQFIADTSDTTYGTGQVALVAAAAGRTGIEVAFDNLSVAEALPQ